MTRVLPVLFVSLCLFGFCCSDYITSPAYYNTTGHWYQLVVPNSPVNYTQAFNNASGSWLANSQGYLLTPNDAAEQAFVTNTYFSQTNVAYYPTSNQYLATWTGGRAYPNQTWYFYALTRVSAVYSTGSNCNQYCNWATGQPSPSTSLYMQVEFAGYPSGTAGKWIAADFITGLSSLFVIEYDPPTGCTSAGYTYVASPTPHCVLSATKAPTTAPTATPAPTHVPTPAPTATHAPTAAPTATPIPPTASPAPTPVPPTASPAPTPVPPTASPAPTPVPPTASPAPTPVPPTATPIPTASPTGTPGSWCLIQGLAGLVSDLQNGSTTAGTPVVVNNITGSDSQLWRIDATGFIWNKLTGLVMDINGADFNPGTQVIIWPAKSLDQAGNQLWNYTNGAIVSQGDNQLTQDVYEGYAVPQQPVIVYWVKTQLQNNENQMYTFVPQN